MKDEIKEILEALKPHKIGLDSEMIYKDYYELKSRNEKAIDKIQYIIDYGFDYDGFNTVESLKGLIDMLVDYARQSKDILQGSDKNDNNRGSDENDDNREKTL